MPNLRWMLVLPVLLMVGCVQSLHKGYTAEQLTYQPALEGTWQSTEEKPTQLILRGIEADKRYEMYIIDDEKKKTGPYDVHIALVSNHYFVDVTAAKPASEPPVELQAAIGMSVPTHCVLLADITPPTANLRVLNYNWIKTYLADHPAELKHEMIDNEILLTASTAELQAFMLKHEKTENAFGGSIEFRKVSTVTTPAP